MTWLDNSRIIAIFAVLFLHSAAVIVINTPVGTESWWWGNLYDSLVRWCIPVFVMISGALLLDPEKQEGLKTFYLKRLSKILLPILFWSAFFLLWKALKISANGGNADLTDLAKTIWHGAPYYHMWFLYMIVSLYIFTPFIRKIISHSSRTEIAALILFSFIFSLINGIAVRIGWVESNLFINWFLPYIPYFILGYFIRTSNLSLPIPGLLGIFGTSVFLTAAGCYVAAEKAGLNAGYYFYDYLSITVIPMSASIFFILRLWSKPIGNQKIAKTISSLTLGIYLIHPVFLDIIEYAGYGPGEFNQAISIPAVTIVTFILSLCTAWIIKKTPYINRII